MQYIHNLSNPPSHQRAVKQQPQQPSDDSYETRNYFASPSPKKNMNKTNESTSGATVEHAVPVAEAKGSDAKHGQVANPTVITEQINSHQAVTTSVGPKANESESKHEIDSPHAH